MLPLLVGSRFCFWRRAPSIGAGSGALVKYCPAESRGIRKIAIPEVHDVRRPQEPEWNSGQNAKTLVRFDDFRVVLRSKGQPTQPGHQTKGRLSIQMLTGHVLAAVQNGTDHSLGGM